MGAFRRQSPNPEALFTLDDEHTCVCITFRINQPRQLARSIRAGCYKFCKTAEVLKPLVRVWTAFEVLKGRVICS
jgi:hypothetical protein